ncbi:MAG: sodium:solute symporter family protein [Firmicutes bacterium]|nr:sodium:solute symporter family protein [Bacillota bacterium]
MKWIDSLSIVLFLVTILWIGLKASKRIFSNDDYLLAGRKVKKWPLAFSFAATDLGGSGIIGTLALTYSVGFSGGFWTLCAVPALVVLAFIVPRLFSGLNVTTIPEIFEKRYDKKTRVLVAILHLIGTTMIIAAQNIVASIAISTLTGISFSLALIIATGVFIIYTTAGGLLAVIWTDMLMFFLLIAGVLVTLITLVYEIGGIEQIVNATPENFWGFNGISMMTVSAWVVMNIFLYSTTQPYIQRVFASRDKSSVKFAYCFTGVTYIVYGIMVTLLGIISYVLNPNILNSEYGSIETIFQNIPMGLSSLLLVIILSATMSTCSSYLNGCASIFTIDIYKRILNPGANGRTCLRVAKISTLGIAFLSLVISYLPVGIVDIVVYGNIVYSAIIFFPLIMGLTTKWVNATGAFYSILIGVITVFIYTVFFFDGQIKQLYFIHPIFIASITSLVVLMIVSYLTRDKNFI